MSTRRYRCSKCGDFELRLRVSDPQGAKPCPTCGLVAERVFCDPPNLLFYKLNLSREHEPKNTLDQQSPSININSVNRGVFVDNIFCGNVNISNSDGIYARNNHVTGSLGIKDSSNVTAHDTKIVAPKKERQGS